MSIELRESERVLWGSIKALLKKIKAAFHRIEPEGEDIGTLIQEMGEKAHKLHLGLKANGHEPKHHSYMTENRGLPRDHEKFYMHVHPVEDLLAFIEDEHANDDPVDQTIDHEFEFTVYSRRWGHDDTYSLSRTNTGWDVNFTHSGPCDKAGRPFLYSNFENDMVFYPAALQGLLEWLWRKASEEGLSHESVQESLNQLANWVKATSLSAPSGGVWEGY